MQSIKHKRAAESLEASVASSHHPDLPSLLISSGFSGNNATATITPMTDMSNYLPTPAASNEDMGCPSTTSDHQAFRYASPVEDMYGWDAELDRRESSPSWASMSSADGLDTVALSYRRANGSKHSLLQRVFRVGSSSSIAKIETAI
ncbi:hypothetical protein F53441_10333 [Fusarium austroafricanum]|uniref:Uncharacterized protein n=1 Tax=Fusarium austroafricanum TaxID=2364996 RepID=A0A8H4KAY4_9HYPO|nr:hypothetical protein F53441_10333 [Fusarium austroafricanum]